MIFRKKEDELETLRNEIRTLWRGKGFSEEEIEQRILDVEINSTRKAIADMNRLQYDFSEAHNGIIRYGGEAVWLCLSCRAMIPMSKFGDINNHRFQGSDSPCHVDIQRMQVKP